MSVWSDLENTLHKESQSRLVNGEIIFIEDGKKISKKDSIFRRKLKKVLNLLNTAEQEGEKLTKEAISATIHALREILPHLHEQERLRLESAYDDMRDNNKRRK